MDEKNKELAQLSQDDIDLNAEAPSLEDFYLESEAVGSKPLKFNYPDQASTVPVLLVILACITLSAYAWSENNLSLFSLRKSHVTDQAEHWRLFSALFLHKDIVHFLSNSWMLFIFGWLLYYYFKSWIFPIMSILIGALTNYFTILTHAPNVGLVGASGMVYGMAAQWLIYFVVFDKQHSYLHKISRSLAFVLIVLFPSTYDPKVSYLAHGIGFTIGLAITLLTLPIMDLSKDVFYTSDKSLI